MRAAWNVLADPFQRSRYDERIGTASTNGDGPATTTTTSTSSVDDDADEPGTQLTGLAQAHGAATAEEAGGPARATARTGRRRGR